MVLQAVLAAGPLAGQAVPPAQTTPPTDTTPPILSDAASGSYERRDALPSINVYLPEMQASIRLRKLIRNVLFESQIDYEFISGDISTYLRYKYYARNYFYRIGVFDTIEFPDVGERSTREFERVRGGLLLIGIPRDYNNRYFALLQDDRLTFGDLTDPDNKKNNVYVKLGYQFGTQFDERMNSIVGETRGRITPVLTAFRDIGPQATGFAAAVTQSARVATGDYRYTKVEAEGLRRFDITSTSFIFSRLHVGAFGAYNELRDEQKTRPCPETPEIQCPIPEIQWYSIPRSEMFSLGGREALRAVDFNERSQGTHEVHITNEYFTPIFRNRDYKTGPLHWNTMYGIAYLGAGTVGYDYDQITRTDEYVVDAGLGFEASIAFRDYDILFSVLYARTVMAPTCIPPADITLPPPPNCRDLEGANLRFSVRTIR